MTIKKLLDEIRNYNPKADLKLVEKAYYYAKKAHQGQKRSHGDDYITHPLQTAYYLAKALKEEAKHYSLIEYRLLRPLLIEIGERLNLPKDGIFNQ